MDSGTILTRAAVGAIAAIAVMLGLLMALGWTDASLDADLLRFAVTEDARNSLLIRAQQLALIAVAIERAVEAVLIGTALNGTDRREAAILGYKKRDAQTESMVMAFALGLAVAFSGLGLLDSILAACSEETCIDGSPQLYAWRGADTFITAALLAGGASAFHQLAERIKKIVRSDDAPTVNTGVQYLNSSDLPASRVLVELADDGTARVSGGTTSVTGRWSGAGLPIGTTIYTDLVAQVGSLSQMERLSALPLPLALEDGRRAAIRAAAVDEIPRPGEVLLPVNDMAALTVALGWPSQVRLAVEFRHFPN